MPNTHTAGELKACPNPWCNSINRPLLAGTGLDEDHRRWVVRCGCGISTFRHPTESEAVKRWNHRPVDTELLEALKAARAALHFHYVEWDGEPEDAVPLQLARTKCDAAIIKAEAGS